MRTIVFLIITLAFISCSKKSSSNFLKKSEVQLVQPTIHISNQLIDSFVVLNAELNYPNVEIRYTTDDSEPNKDSKLVDGELKITEPINFKFKAFHPELVPSQTITTSLAKKGKSIKSIQWISRPSEKYSGSGENTLTNHTKGSLNFGDKQWLGFDNKAHATVYFEKPTDISSIDLGYLSSPGSWIFPPRLIKISISKDGNTFISKEITELKSLEKNVNSSIQILNIPIEESVLAIELEIENESEIPSWHEGKGKKGWLFMDEWIFN
ncbi:FN3 associated domain-containing protein [Urechidicola vernalis]|uniref:FN3 associated domain-containing protein n=1 Tax=Urechidicola vernalis TaxID=3075600 RepID=A0ABU2Y853_9FLAO|nr:FN3 associated domain-containing protein [Urechidicola sp. P050]MDT0553228.1 FN3 associated domain-containing protein [Urechidicola sp. P050]